MALLPMFFFFSEACRLLDMAMGQRLENDEGDLLVSCQPLCLNIMFSSGFCFLFFPVSSFIFFLFLYSLIRFLEIGAGKLSSTCLFCPLPGNTHSLWLIFHHSSLASSMLLPRTLSPLPLGLCPYPHGFDCKECFLSN